MLTDEWPPFLSTIHSNDGSSGDGGAQLADFLFKLLTIRPPKYLSLWVKVDCGEHLQDFIQDLYIHLQENDFARLQTYNKIDGRPFAAWILLVARRLMLECIRSRKPEVDLDDIVVDPPPPPIPAGLARAVQACLEKLSDYQRTLIYLRYYDGLKPREIERLLRVSAKKIADDARYALQLVRECVRKHYPMGPDDFRMWLGGR